MNIAVFASHGGSDLQAIIDGCNNHYGFYRLVCEVLNEKKYRIIYLKEDDIRVNLDIIRKERSDASGSELWYPMMLGFFNDCPYSKARGLRGDDDLIDHFRHRQDLELRICEEIFPDNSIILKSKDYTDESIKQLLSVSI